MTVYTTTRVDLSSDAWAWQDIARAALFLCSEDASWVTGVGIPVDGGYSSM